MKYRTLVTAEELEENLGEAHWRVVDCRFSLSETERGRQAYLSEHVAGAVYAHLDEDLSGEIIAGRTGRHPLPPVSEFVETLSAWGISRETQVVAYDDASGAIAARLWWMLNWLGHEAVAVLDGGWKRWKEEGRAVAAGVEGYAYESFKADLRPELGVDSGVVDQVREDPDFLLIDARARERYEGEVEPIDVKAGHIPGAICYPFAENLGDDGRFLSPERLKARFQDLLDGVPPERAIFYCGSGVTAAHNLLALKHAGMGNAKLYSGSWSEWITDPERPIESIH